MVHDIEMDPWDMRMWPTRTIIMEHCFFLAAGANIDLNMKITILENVIDGAFY